METEIKVDENTQNIKTSGFVTAKKMITNTDLLEKFKKSKTYQKILDYLIVFQAAVKSTNKNDTAFPDVNLLFYY